jgi:hypothetical protein
MGTAFPRATKEDLKMLKWLHARTGLSERTMPGRRTNGFPQTIFPLEEIFHRTSTPRLHPANNRRIGRMYLLHYGPRQTRDAAKWRGGTV